MLRTFQPGVHAAAALLDGRSLEGTWFNRTKEYGARLRGEEIGARSFAEPELLSLEPLPCWKHLSAEDYQKRIADLVRQIEAEAAAKREATGVEPIGRDAILRQSPETALQEQESPAPRFHAFTKRVRRELYEAYAWFVAAFPRGRGEVEGWRPQRQLSYREAFRRIFHL